MWAPAADPLPILTRVGHHTKSPECLACVGAYQMLPDFTMAPIWLDPAREDHLPTPRPGLVIEHIEEYDEVSGQGGPGHAQWHTVGVVGIVGELLAPWPRWQSESKRFSSGAQASK